MMKEETKEKIAAFWKKHKIKIVVGGTVIIGGTITYIIMRKCKSNSPSSAASTSVIETQLLNSLFTKKGVQKKKVNISGLDYDVIFANLKDTLGLDDTAGWCGKSIPVILIDNKNKPFWITDNQVIRHELMHAFFFRNGMKDYSADEKLVDWLANELPNIQKACQQLDCVE